VTKSVAKAPALKDHKDYINKVKQQVINYSGRVMPALKNDADIIDNRADFY
jgi:peptidyl-prolyl cis-trans isomerase D